MLYVRMWRILNCICSFHNWFLSEGWIVYRELDSWAYWSKEDEFWCWVSLCSVSSGQIFTDWSSSSEKFDSYQFWSFWSFFLTSRILMIRGDRTRRILISGVCNSSHLGIIEGPNASPILWWLITIVLWLYVAHLWVQEPKVCRAELIWIVRRKRGARSILRNNLDLILWSVRKVSDQEPEDLQFVTVVE